MPTLRGNGFSYRYETTAATFQDRSVGNDVEIMLFYSLGGSTLQWDVGRGLMCLAALIIIIAVAVLLLY